MRIHFPTSAVRTVAAHAEASELHAPSFDQLFEGAFRKDGKDLDVDTLKSGEWPTEDDIDMTKVPKGLWLCGDRGIYILSNGHPSQQAKPDEPHLVNAMAVEADPDTKPFDEWYDVKRAAFGGDDGVHFLDWDFVEALLATDDRGWVSLNLTPTEISVPVPKPRKKRPA